MNIIIVGDGKVGSTLVELLTREGHNIVVVDNNSEALKHTADVLDVMTYIGNGASYDILQKAGADKAELVIAATSSDELNLLCCMVAKKLGTGHTIARVRNPDYEQQMLHMKEELGLSMSINPELATAEEISRLLRFPSAIQIEPFAKGKVELVEVRLKAGSPLCGMDLKSLTGSSDAAKVLVCAVLRGNEVTIPGGEFRLADGDKVTMLGTPEQITAFFRRYDFKMQKIKHVLIAGGGRIAYYLARELQRIGVRVTIVDNDINVCHALTDQLPSISVINGDANDRAVLAEAGIGEADAFVALTGMDESNIILSMFAASKGISRIITKVNQVSFPDVFDRIGLDTLVSPKQTTANQILSYVRARQNSLGSSVETLYKLVGGQVEALEFIAQQNSRVLGIPLKELHLKKGLLIGCIVHAGRAVTPGGNDSIKAGDSVIIVTTGHSLNDLNDILE